jgi:hypothetical protein
LLQINAAGRKFNINDKVEINCNVIMKYS